MIRLTPSSTRRKPLARVRSREMPMMKSTTELNAIRARNGENRFHKRHGVLIMIRNQQADSQ